MNHTKITMREEQFSAEVKKAVERLYLNTGERPVDEDQTGALMMVSVLGGIVEHSNQGLWTRQEIVELINNAWHELFH